MDKLFYDSDNKLFTVDDIREALVSVGANECETLFIHSDVMFGRPAEGFKKRTYLETLYEVITEIGVKNIVVPSFTYSFCNSEDYDIQNSKTSFTWAQSNIDKIVPLIKSTTIPKNIDAPTTLKLGV